jgi:hypothetical protein
MPKKSLYRRAIEAEAQRVAELTAKIAAMTDAQLAADLLVVKGDIEAIDHERRVSPNDPATAKYHAFQWGRLSEKVNLIRAELDGRRVPVAA